MKVFRTIAALVLAILVMLSSTSFMIGMHFCMGEVQDVALFTKADACEMEQNLPPCHRHMKAACCEDETLIHQGDDFNASIADLQIIAPAPADAEQPPVLISELVPSSPVSVIKYYFYDPPLPCPDITVEQQVFLI
jgi:hypothetical protein